MAGGYDTLQAMLQGRPVVFHPVLARAFGGINEALLFQQLAFWSDKGRDPEWIYKTQRELQEETCLTRTQQESARKSLRTLGVVEEKKQGLPAKLYFRVVWSTVFAVLDEHVAAQDAGNLQPRVRSSRKDAGNPQTRMQEIDRPGRSEPADQFEGNQQPLTRNTEKTTKTRTDISTDRHVEKSLTDDDVVVEDDDLDGTTELYLTNVLTQTASKLRDEADLNRSFGRLANIYRDSKLDHDQFVDRVDRAVARTLRANVEKEREDGRGNNRMPYFFGVLENLLGLGKDREPVTGPVALPTGEDPYDLPVNRGGRVIHRISRTQTPRRPGATG